MSRSDIDDGRAVSTTRTGRAVARPSTLSLVAGQFRYANRSYWRTPVAAFFTLIFPTTFLVVICAIAGNEILDDRSGVRLAQFLTPVFAVFGVCMASFVSLALGVAYAREAGVLRRLRTTPLPPWIHLAGRLVAAVFISLVAVTVVTGIGTVFYGVDIVWRTLPAVLLTLIVGIACFAALGLAAVSITPTPGATQALANGGLILLAFISDVFIVALPDWLDTVGWIFPLKHFVNAVSDGFNPFLTGSGLYWDHLAVLIAWGTIGAAVALRFFTWEPRPERGRGRRRRTRRPEPAGAGEEGAPVDLPAAVSVAALSPVVGGSRRSAASLVLGRTRFTAIGLLRDPMSVFFSVVFPVVMLVFFSSIYGRDVMWAGLPLPQYLAAAFSVYGVAVMAYVNQSAAVADDRTRLVLKRLRGTPLPPWAYIAGRVGACMALGMLTVLVVFAVGAVLFGVRVGPVPFLATVLVFVVVIGCMSALGILLASLVASTQSVLALALGTLLPLAMISDIFVNAPDLPATLSAIGWTFPLRHMAHAAAQASSGQALDAGWLAHLGVITLWGVVAGLLAWRLFRWEPRRG